MNQDVEDLSNRIDISIGNPLQYACKYWMTHLNLGLLASEDSHEALGHLCDFFERTLLGWFEVLSLVGDLRRGVHCLHDLQQWLSNVRTSNRFT